MPRIGVKLGLTLKMSSGDGFNFFRPEVSIDDIDTDTDINPQIDAALQAVHEAYKAAEKAVSDIVDTSEIADHTSVVQEMRERMTSMEADLQKLKISGPTSGEFELSVGDDEDW